MTGTAAEPERGFEPTSGAQFGSFGSAARGASPRGTLSTVDWDPDNPIFDQRAVADLRANLESLSERLGAEADRIDQLAPTGLLAPGANVEVPSGWDETRGNPSYYLRAAGGYVKAAMQGTVCRLAHPPGSREERPPPAGQWCCDHDEPHCS